VNLLEARRRNCWRGSKTEGNNSPADVLVLVDAARLQRAQDDKPVSADRLRSLNRDVPPSCVIQGELVRPDPPGPRVIMVNR